MLYKKNIITFILVLIILSMVLVCTFLYKKHKFLTSNDNTVQIVFTTDKYYTEYLKVAIYSLIKNKNPKSKYNINILCVDLPEKKIEEFKKFEKENVTINTIPKSVNDINVTLIFPLDVHVTKADIFKLSLPDIFKDYDKILYLDGDILVLNDLSDLFNINLKRKYIGVVEKLNKFQYREYNTGVILFNLKKMRRDNIVEKLLQEKEQNKNINLMTQDTFNLVLGLDKSVMLLPQKYNFMTYDAKKFQDEKFKNKFLKQYSSLDDLYRDSVIIHFAGYKKPWNCGNYCDSLYGYNEWWQYAKEVNSKWNKENLHPDNMKYD